jgi:transcriptional antiterminator/mannitol/fructose-specific phosphotransferase system IIA component (Ntr-type)
MLAFPNKRSGKLLEILLQKESEITITELAEKFTVSARTIRSDLTKLAEWLADRKINLIKKPGSGVWLEINNTQREFLQTRLDQLKNYQAPVSPEKREKLILKYLLSAEHEHTMEELAKKLFVSRSTIYNDLTAVERWLNNYDLELERRQNFGVYVIGSEKNWRKAVAELLVDLKNDKELKLMLSNEFGEISAVEDNVYQQLADLFGELDFKRIEEIIRQVEFEAEFSFADEAITALVIHIAIALERLNKNKDVEMSNEQLAVLRSKKEFKIAEKIAIKINAEYKIEIPASEIGYISLHILGSKIQQNIENADLKHVIKNSDPETVKIAVKIINRVTKILDYDFNSDEQLLLGLILHLRTAINRLKYGLSIRNPILNKIKQNYPDVFGAAWSCSIIFQQSLDLKVNEDEIGYIALHLGASKERLAGSFKTIIVCGSGVGTSQLIASKLRRYLPHLEIVDILSTHELIKYNLAEIDFVITTIPINSDKLPVKVIKVSAFLSQFDLKQLKNQLAALKNCNAVTTDNLIEPEVVIKNLFDLEFIWPGLNLQTPTAVIKFLAKKLQNKKDIDFTEDVLEREKTSSTAVGKGIAIPHARVSNLDQQQVAVATLAKPIKWGEDKVQLIFLLNIEQSIAKKFFSYFYRIMEDDLFLERLKSAQTKAELYLLLTKGEIINE